MANINIYLIVVSTILVLGQCGCVRENWWSSFDRGGLSLCNNQRLIRGFFRSQRQDPDAIYRLEEADCCDIMSPWNGYAKQTVHANWWHSMNVNNNWSNCPPGHFLEGLYRTDIDPGWLHNIEEGRCTKPRGHPHYYGHCYDQDISQCFDNENLCQCNDSYFVTGLYRGGCDSLHCLEKLRCCKMASNSEPLEEVSQVKTRIMDSTVSVMALLAHYLGYGWCAGCRSPYVGDDFYRVGDSWRADTSRDCTGYKSDHRLSIAYGDWSFGIKDTTFGNPVLEALLPETVDSGTIHNNDASPATKTISISETFVQTVSHKTTSTWKDSVELGIQVGISILSASYKFSFEDSTSTEDSTGKQNSRTFQINTSKTLPANSSASWNLVVTKTRKTIPYTATIIARFSAELQGFLRSSGDYNDDSTNFHIQHRGSSDRPTFNYRFGNARTPFYAALKQQSERQSPPWMWNDMKNKYSSAQSLIDDLCNENNYVFTLTGQFEVVEGRHIDLYWQAVRPPSKRSADHYNLEQEGNYIVKNLKHSARAGPDDVPAPRPPPPEVKVEVERGPKVFPFVLQGD